MHIRVKAKKIATIAGAAGIIGGGMLLGPLGGVASAAGGGVVTAPGASSNTPVGPYSDGQVITVSGTGFSKASADTISVVECADPGGLISNLPTDNSGCDGATINPLAIKHDANGNFTAQYTISADSVSGGGAINCDASNYCALWVGEDFNNNFPGTTAQPTAFSAPFLIGATPPAPESPLTIALPIAAAGVAGGTGFFFFRRRRASVTS
jgi:hypothetical protein